MLHILTQADEWLLLFINGLHRPWADVLMWNISNKWTYVPMYTWILYLWIKKMGIHAWYPVLLTCLLLLLTDQISAHFLKPFFQRQRPCHNESLKQVLYIINDVCKGKYGFVSSHAANTAGFMVFTGVLIGKNYIRNLLLAVTFIVGFSRIYLAVHYPFDVLLGWLFGIVLGQVMVYVYVKFYPTFLHRHHIPNGTGT